MNWYKIAQLSNVELLDQDTHQKDYLAIGHEGEYGNTGEKPNYMWVFYDGQILVKEETDEKPIHECAFSNMPLDKLYSGRFESKTGRLSIMKPNIGYASYREIPKSILYKLYQAFPSIKQIYKF